MGCLMLPFRLLFGGLVAAAVVVGWLYRDQLLEHARRRLDGPRAESTGRPGRRSMASARAKIDSLTARRADSVRLTASETASLLADVLPAETRRQLDSVVVTLGEGEIGVKASLATARLPRELLGPLAVAVHDREPIDAAGPLRMVGPGRGEWAVRRFTIRDFPIPSDAVPRLIARALGDPGRRSLPLRMPQGVREIRVHPDAVTLLGAPAR